jgi:ZIP family zinc transporter
MLVASVSLSVEGYMRDEEHGAWRVVLGNIVGAVFLLVMDYALHGYDSVLAIGELRGADARKALLVVGIMTVHSFAEGVGIGVSFGGSSDASQQTTDLGVLISSTIAAHNAPEVSQANRHCKM